MRKKYKNARKILLNREEKNYEKDLLEKIFKIMKKRANMAKMEYY